jgi:hypothetical protein
MTCFAALCGCAVTGCEIDHRSLVQTALTGDGGRDGAAGQGGTADSGGTSSDSAGAGDGGSSAGANGGESGEESGGNDSGAGEDGSGDATSYGGASANGGMTDNGGTSANGGGGRTSTGGAGGGAPTAGAPAVLCPDLDGDSVPDCSQTLLRNATFDAAFTDTPANWHVASGATATWDSLDAMSSSSGSIVVTSSNTTGAALGVDQCVALQAGKSYEAYALMLLQAKTVNGFARMSAIFYPSSDCSGSFDRVVPSAPEGTTNSWRTMHIPPSPALKDGSLLLRLEVLKADGAISISVHFDSVLLIGK